MSPRLLGERWTVREIRDELDAIANEISHDRVSYYDGYRVVDVVSYAGSERLRELRLALDRQLLQEGDGLAAQ